MPLELTVGDVLLDGAWAASLGALMGGLSGSAGNSALSFFNPSLAIGSFATFAALGAITVPLIILPRYLIHHFLNNSSFLSRHPNLTGFIKDTTDVLLCLGAVASAALLLGTPFGAAVMSMMIIPAAIYALSTLCRAINALITATTPDESLDLENTVAI